MRIGAGIADSANTHLGLRGMFDRRDVRYEGGARAKTNTVFDEQVHLELRMSLSCHRKGPFLTASFLAPFDNLSSPWAFDFLPP